MGLPHRLFPLPGGAPQAVSSAPKPAPAGARPAPGPMSARGPVSGVHRVRRHTVVVIEADDAARRTIADALSPVYHVVEASTALEAGELLGGIEAPSVVICSVRLPDIDGLTLSKMLRAHEAFRTVPFIFLTAEKDAREMARAIAAGARHTIAKPIPTDELLRKVARSVVA